MNDKISLLIFSKDRAAQLSLLLESIERNAPDEFDISIIYRSSNKDFRKGYDLLRSQVECESIEFWSEDDLESFDTEKTFKDKVLRVMDWYEGYPLLSFCTDDVIMYKNAPLKQIKKYFKDAPEVVGAATLRVGFDTRIDCYYNGQKLPFLYASHIMDDLIAWRHLGYPANSAYQYALSLDMHIYDYQTILNLVRDTEFNNPNELEAGLSGKTNLLKPYMIAGLEQSCVAVPANSVALWNQSGTQYPFSTEFLNRQFLDGFEIDLNAAIEYCKENISCTHGEIPYQFCERSE